MYRQSKVITEALLYPYGDNGEPVLGGINYINTMGYTTLLRWYNATKISRDAVYTDTHNITLKYMILYGGFSNYSGSAGLSCLMGMGTFSYYIATTYTRDAFYIASNAQVSTELKLYGTLISNMTAGLSCMYTTSGRGGIDWYNATNNILEMLLVDIVT